MNILFLGSSGTICKPVVDFLKKKNYNVIEWDIKNSLEQDLRIKNNIDKIIRNIDLVIFAAFDVGGSKYNIKNINYIDNNVNIIINTFHSIHKFNKKVIYFSSQMSNMNHNSYGVLKKLGDFYAELCQSIIIRIWNVFNIEEESEKSHVIPDFINYSKKNGVIKMLTDGLEERQFLNIYDFCNAIHILIINFDKFKNKYVDITTNKWTSIYDIAKIIKDKFKKLYNKNITIIPGIKRILCK